MARPLIVLGDKTDHGGTVISADMTVDINGKYVARIGDMTVCPKCKGTFPINSAAADLVDGSGRGYARHDGLRRQAHIRTDHDDLAGPVQHGRAG